MLKIVSGGKYWWNNWTPIWEKSIEFPTSHYTRHRNTQFKPDQRPEYEEQNFTTFKGKYKIFPFQGGEGFIKTQKALT